jgi:hypothetical protein
VSHTHVVVRCSRKESIPRRSDSAIVRLTYLTKHTMLTYFENRRASLQKKRAAINSLVSRGGSEATEAWDRGTDELCAGCQPRSRNRWIYAMQNPGNCRPPACRRRLGFCAGDVALSMSRPLTGIRLFDCPTRGHQG